MKIAYLHHAACTTTHGRASAGACSSSCAPAELGALLRCGASGRVDGMVFLVSAQLQVAFDLKEAVDHLICAAFELQIGRSHCQGG